MLRVYPTLHNTNGRTTKEPFAEMKDSFAFVRLFPFVLGLTLGEVAVRQLLKN